MFAAVRPENSRIIACTIFHSAHKTWIRKSTKRILWLQNFISKAIYRNWFEVNRLMRISQSPVCRLNKLWKNFTRAHEVTQFKAQQVAKRTVSIATSSLRSMRLEYEWNSLCVRVSRVYLTPLGISRLSVTSSTNLTLPSAQQHAYVTDTDRSKNDNYRVCLTRRFRGCLASAYRCIKLFIAFNHYVTRSATLKRATRRTSRLGQNSFFSIIRSAVG